MKLVGLRLLGLVAFLSMCIADNFDVSATLNKLAQGYDKRLRPNLGGAAVDVTATTYFLNIYDINTKDQTVKSDFYFRQAWSDPRLVFEAPPGKGFIYLGSDALGVFWEPDTFMPEAHERLSHQNEGLFRLSSDGNVFKSFRMIATSRIAMDLRYFPFDKQLFSLTFESFGFGASDLRYKWKSTGSPVALSNDAGQHDITVEACRHTSQLLQLSFGNYSRIGVECKLIRNSGYYTRHMYLPAVMAFLCSWLPFWLAPALSAVRVFLCLASVLLGNQLLVRAQDYLPPVHDSTMLERYIVFCLVMAALALMECSLVAYLSGTASGSASGKSDLDVTLMEVGSRRQGANDGGQNWQTTVQSYTGRFSMFLVGLDRKVDLFFRALFAVVFVIYNIWYWSVIS